MARARVSMVALWLFGCVQAHDLDAPAHDGSGSSPADGQGSAGSGGGSDDACQAQMDAALDGLPDDFACFGLFKDMKSKDVSKGMRAYTPAELLWSDGAEKHRWIYLPKGEKIDASDPKEWVFPVGTTLFKEFKVDGKRVETRVYRKLEDHWANATYRWNDDESGAVRMRGGDLDDVELAGYPYHLPTGRECDQCHNGRRDRILGFESVALGLPGAMGVTLASLVEDDLIEPAPDLTEFEIGDDGTGKAAEALGWLHINCGVSCHNGNGDAEAYSSGLRLRLDPAELDGRAATEFDQLTTTVGVHAKTLRWADQVRIDPGSPDTSLLYKLASFRGGGKNDQMPPIASHIIDPEHTPAIYDWIKAMDGSGSSGGQIGGVQ